MCLSLEGVGSVGHGGAHCWCLVLSSLVVQAHVLHLLQVVLTSRDLVTCIECCQQLAQSGHAFTAVCPKLHKL